MARPKEVANAKPVLLHLDDAVVKKAKKIATKKDESFSAMVRRLLLREVESDERQSRK